MFCEISQTLILTEYVAAAGRSAKKWSNLKQKEIIGKERVIYLQNVWKV